MSEKMIAMQVPESTYRKLQRAAEMTYRSVDEVLLSTIETTLPSPENLPPDVAAELAAMHLFSDDALRSASEPTLSAAAQARLTQINQLAGTRELTGAEKTEQQDLLTDYYHSLVRRAQALAILAQRGHPVSPDNLKTPVPVE